MEDTIGSQVGTIFLTKIQNHNINTLFDTGATSSIMSGEMFRKLTNKTLDTSRLPRVVIASGASLGALGCNISINGYHFDQTFLVCEHIKRAVILGIDFARNFSAGVHWTKEGTRVLTIDGQTICEASERERPAGSPIYLKQPVKIPPGQLQQLK